MFVARFCMVLAAVCHSARVQNTSSDLSADITAATSRFRDAKVSILPRGFTAAPSYPLKFQPIAQDNPNGISDDEKAQMPDFLIVGTQKSGSESLLHMLDDMGLGCSGSGMHRGSEGQFWSHDMIDIKLPMYLERWSDCDSHTLRFDKTPEYSFVPSVPALISELVPPAKQKVVFLLRDPIHRAISGFKAERNGYAQGDDSPEAFHQMVTFEIAIVEQCREVPMDSVDYPSCCSNAVKSVDPKFANWDGWQGCGPTRWWSQNHVRRGLYYDQLQQWYKHIHRDDVLIFISEEIFNHTAEVALEIDSWVWSGIHVSWPKPGSNISAKGHQDWFGKSYNLNHQANATSSMRKDTYELLANFYRSFHTDLELLLGRKIKQWSYTQSVT